MEEILVGVDGSEQSKRALSWAMEEAGLRDVPVRVVYVYVAGAPGESDQRAPAAMDVRHRAEALLDQAVDEVLAASDAEVKVIREVVATPAAGVVRVLLEYAKTAQLLVLGSRGLGGFMGLLVGSVSAQCVAHASCPIVVIRSPEPAAA